jgi:hypothetical protein
MTKEQMEFSIMDRTIQSIQTEFQVISSRKLSNFSFRLIMVVPAGTHLRVPPPFRGVIQCLFCLSCLGWKGPKTSILPRLEPFLDKIGPFASAGTQNLGWDFLKITPLTAFSVL